MLESEKSIRLLRASCAELHQKLLAWQQIKYEKAIGRISNSSQFLSIVASHPDFGWLKTLSELLMSIDMVLEEKNQSNKIYNDAFVYAKSLFAPISQRSDFGKKYRAALADNPEVVLAHAQLIKVFNKK